MVNPWVSLQIARLTEIWQIEGRYAQISCPEAERAMSPAILSGAAITIASHAQPVFSFG